MIVHSAQSTVHSITICYFIILPLGIPQYTVHSAQYYNIGILLYRLLALHMVVELYGIVLYCYLPAAFFWYSGIAQHWAVLIILYCMVSLPLASCCLSRSLPTMEAHILLISHGLIAE